MSAPSSPVSSRKCLGLGTPILMYDGTTKSVEKIKVGDVLMGDNSTPRHVLSLTQGREQMASITDIKNKHLFTCNMSHILSLKTSGLLFVRKSHYRYETVWYERVFDVDGTVKILKRCAKSFTTEIEAKEYATIIAQKEDVLSTGNTIDISVRNYLNMPMQTQICLKGYTCDLLEFSGGASLYDLPFDPYLVGMWLGDGGLTGGAKGSNRSSDTLTMPNITTMDPEIVSYLNDLSNRI